MLQSVPFGFQVLLDGLPQGLCVIVVVLHAHGSHCCRRKGIVLSAEEENTRN